MKKLPPLSDKHIQLSAGMLDLQAPAGETPEGYFRIILNAIGDARGQLHRLGGFRRLSLSPEVSADTFAIVGDFGSGDSNETAVAQMALGWSPSFVVSTGDNVYNSSSSMTQGQLDAVYAAAMAPYSANIAAGTFYPVIGNHDTDFNTSWFRGKFPSLFGSKNYYTFTKGSVQFFMLNSGYKTDGTMYEPDGNTTGSVQQQWLAAQLSASTAVFKIVVLHHPPYTSDSAYHPGYAALRWDFAGMGADAVISGHAHNYERWKDKSIPYIITGTGGAELRGYYPSNKSTDASSVVDNPPRFGALKVNVQAHEMTIDSIAVDGTTIETFVISKGTNEDLHDQLLSQHNSATIIAALPRVYVTKPMVSAGVPVSSSVSIPGVTISVPTISASQYTGISTDLPAIIVSA